MKKFILVIFFSLFLSNPLYAIYDGCYSESERTQFWRSYCTCYSNKFADIYNDEQLIIFLDQNEGKDLSKHPLVRRFAKECIDDLT